MKIKMMAACSLALASLLGTLPAQAKGKKVSPVITDNVEFAAKQVQLMVVSDKISLSDGQSHDKDLEEHESIVDDCVTLLHKHKFFASSKLMILQSSETIYDHQGYMVTSLIFKTAISI